jgi:hypothetical protein
MDRRGPVGKLVERIKMRPSSIEIREECLYMCGCNIGEEVRFAGRGGWVTGLPRLDPWGLRPGLPCLLAAATRCSRLAPRRMAGSRASGCWCWTSIGQSPQLFRVALPIYLCSNVVSCQHDFVCVSCQHDGYTMRCR